MKVIKVTWSQVLFSLFAKTKENRRLRKLKNKQKNGTIYWKFNIYITIHSKELEEEINKLCKQTC